MANTPDGVYGTIRDLDFVRLTESAEAEIRRRLPIALGDTLTVNKLRETEEVLASISNRLTIGTVRGGPGGPVSLTIGYREWFAIHGTKIKDEDRPKIGGRVFPLADKDADRRPPSRITVGHGVMRRKAIRKVQPKYPELAKQAGVEGHVLLAALIDGEGDVVQLEVQAGHPLLVPAALEAVKQWRYKPTLLNGQPVEVETTVEVNFTLAP